MRTILGSFLAVICTAVAFADDADPPLDNKRLTIHTLVREDIFAGWRAKNMERFERGERNIDLLLEQRPQARADLLAWKGGAKLYRAVLAREAGNDAEFQKLFDETVALFDEAKSLAPKSGGVAAVVGGSYVTFGDRLPKELQPAAWQQAYDSYQVLWSQQGKLVDRLPLHIQGELLAGLVQSAQRTGRDQEYNEYLDKIIEVMPDTAYARVANQWKSDPAAAAKGNISCKSCHADGRLEARLVVTQGK